jgi:hypothetical protein
MNRQNKSARPGCVYLPFEEISGSGHGLHLQSRLKDYSEFMREVMRRP